MQAIFMGTPDFAVPSLKALVSSEHTVLAVVTQPDRPKGRHLHMQPSPVKTFGQEQHLLILQPQVLNDDGFKENIAGLNPEVIVVVAYGKIIPKWMLSLPPHGCINVHASLLPRYRGAAPVQRAVMDGCTETGITTMLLDEGIDTGDILLQSRVRIESEETSGNLAKKLSQEGAKLLSETLDGIAKNTIKPKEQNEQEVSYAPRIEKEEALLDWSKPAPQLKDLIRALNPAPGAYTFFRGERLKVWDAKTSRETNTSRSEIGTVVGFESDGIRVTTSDGLLILTILQLENKRRMTASEFLRGHTVKIGEKLG